MPRILPFNVRPEGNHLVHVLLFISFSIFTFIKL
uniref:Uncharacterized protein n=1 Tax=Arundo donax TaxID=35708 RepID=A0A0A8ZMY3_ARUDO